MSENRPDRPIRFEDSARNAAYWARIERNVADAPPLTDEQKAIIRIAFSSVVGRSRGAATQAPDGQ
ncbi:hypothetical protein ACPC36_08260 [Streptomyces pseudogriseolus]|uniref:hypothetical protein n=1 Tax=Streptomyces pseudogriseolus TaxID=36817 RepID=UPI003FA23A0D